MNYPCVTIMLSPCFSPPYVFIKLHFCPVSTASFSVPTLCAIFCLEPSFVFPPSLQCLDLLMTSLLIFTYPPLCVPFCPFEWTPVITLCVLFLNLLTCKADPILDLCHLLSTTPPTTPPRCSRPGQSRTSPLSICQLSISLVIFSIHSFFLSSPHVHLPRLLLLSSLL